MVAGTYHVSIHNATGRRKLCKNGLTVRLFGVI